MNKLEDLLAKKKTVVPVLDLSKNLPQTKEEFRCLMEKVPDFKMRPIRVKNEEIKFKEKDYTFKPSRKEIRKILKQSKSCEKCPINLYLNPVPIEMREIILTDLCSVPIEWKMLTTLRPKIKIEEEYFSRLVEMQKMQMKTKIRDKKENQLINYGIKKIKNKSGIIEIRLIICPECEEELCTGNNCLDFNYDLYTRIEIKPLQSKSSPIKTSINNKGLPAGLRNKKKQITTTYSNSNKQRRHKTSNRKQTKSKQHVAIE